MAAHHLFSAGSKVSISAEAEASATGEVPKDSPPKPSTSDTTSRSLQDAANQTVAQTLPKAQSLPKLVKIVPHPF